MLGFIYMAEEFIKQDGGVGKTGLGLSFVVIWASYHGGVAVCFGKETCVWLGGLRIGEGGTGNHEDL